MFGLSPLLHRNYKKLGRKKRQKKKIYKFYEKKPMRIKFLTKSQGWKRGGGGVCNFEKPSLNIVVSISNDRESKRG